MRIVSMLFLSFLAISCIESGTKIEEGRSTNTSDNSSYYGFTYSSSSAVTTLRNSSSLPKDISLGGYSLVYSNEFYVKPVGSDPSISGDFSSLEQRLIELAIYKPTCPKLGEIIYYSAIRYQNGDLYSGPGKPESANAVSFILTSHSVIVYRHDLQGSTRIDIGSEIFPSTCNNGEITLNNGKGIIFSNGKMILAHLLSEHNLFVGVEKSKLVTVSVSDDVNMTEYSQNNFTACTLVSCNDYSGRVEGGIGYVRISDGDLSSAYLGLGRFTYPTSTGFSQTSHSKVIGDDSVQYVDALTASIGGRRIVLASMPELGTYYADEDEDLENPLFGNTGFTNGISIQLEDK